MKRHPGLEWRIFHIITSDFVIVISTLTPLFVPKYACLYNKKKITWWLEAINFIFSW